MVSCESAVGCSNPAALSVSLLVPTGEVIDSDTGSAPVLKAVASKRLCSLCAAPVAGAGLLARALGCHLDIEPLVTEELVRGWPGAGPWGPPGVSGEPRGFIPCALCGRSPAHHNPVNREAYVGHDWRAPDEPESADPITAAHAYQEWTAADAARLHAAQEGER
jgi:hypothetical protein